MGLTLEQLQKMGAKPVSSFTPGQMTKLGSQPLTSFFGQDNSMANKPTSGLNSATSNLGLSQSLVDKSRGVTDFTSGIFPGIAKSIGSNLMQAGAQHAGPIGAAMSANAPQWAQYMQQGEQAMQPQGAGEQVGHTVGEAGTFLGTGGLDLIKGGLDLAKGLPILKNFLNNRTAKIALDAVISTPETMTSNELTAALKERIDPHAAGGGSLMPSDTENRAAELLKGSVGKNVVKNVPIISEKIAQSGKEAEQYLGMNGKPIDKITHDEIFQEMKDKAAPYLSPAQIKAYDTTIKQFQGELGKMTDMNTGTYYKALKNFESNVTSRLRGGVQNLLTEHGSAQLQAAKDVRTTVRDLISSLHPEFKGKMFDIASLYDAQDTALTKAAQFLKSHGTGKIVGAVKNFAQKHPIITGAGAIAGADTLYNEAKKKLGL